jgi:Domain of unknown function(DUF2779)
MSASYGLSKSLLLKGLQCPKALWLAKNPPAFEFPPRPALEARFAAGTEVGVLAQQLFPGGIEVPFTGLSVAEQVARTRTLIAEGVSVIYEASFAFDGIFVKVDILVRDGEAWQIHEVKMATAVKEVNLNDVAIQYYVLTNCGLPLSRAFLVHIDNSYLRRGPIDVQRLFASEEVTEAALSRQPQLPEVVTALRETLKGDEPGIDIGPWCHAPYECDFIPHCWRHIPENSVFDLRGNGVKKFDLYRRGIVRFEDIPLAELNPAQRQQVEATLKQKNVVDPGGVRAFLDTLWYPLCHLDFETFNSPVPLFDDTRPYQQVPFQFSVHRQSEQGAAPEHFAYLAPPGIEPRRELIEALLPAIPADTCVLTYNQAFEKGVLRQLAELFPDLAPAIEARLKNVRDLMVPFRRRDVYRWQMRGSYSIKEVLPAMVPELSYAGLEIADGMAAMQAYHDMCALGEGEELERLRAALLEYCRLDTLAMVKILGKLDELISFESQKKTLSEVVGKIVYIDANIYLRFFDTSDKELKKHLESIVTISDFIFITEQIKNEVSRRKLGAAQKSFDSNERKLGIDKTTLPEHLDLKDEKIVEKWNVDRKKIIDKERELQKEYLNIIKNKLDQISKSTDNVSIELSKIFDKSKAPTSKQVERARVRREIGNPPGKQGNSLGDQISWEQFLDEYNGEDFWLITNDDDYTVKYNNSVFLNPFLYQELLNKASNRIPFVFLFRDLKEGIKEFMKKYNISVAGAVEDEDKDVPDA